MLWALLIYVLVVILSPSRDRPVFDHWIPLISTLAVGAVAVYLITRKVATKASRDLIRECTNAIQIRRRFIKRAMTLQLLMLGGVYYFVHYMGFADMLLGSPVIISHPWLMPFIYAGVIVGLLFLIQLGAYSFGTAWRHLRDTERLAMGRKIYPWPTPVRYALDQVRVTAGIVLTLLVFSTLVTYGRDYLLAWTHSEFLRRHSGLITELIVVPLFWLIYPYLLVRVLNTRRLEDGALRSRLLAAAKRHGIRITDVRVIQTHHRIANAAWIGTILPLRYILLTDLVLDDFSAKEVEDIFAHELGHGHHRHATWYLLLLMATILWFSAIVGGADRLSGWLGMTVVAVLPMLCLIVLIIAFGKFSRLSEHQADWFAARHWAKRWAEGEPPGVVTGTGTDELDHLSREAMVSGAALGAAALRNLADENMLRMDRTSLTHPSIEDRITSLYTLSCCPYMERRLQCQARNWRWVITLLLAAAIACRVCSYFIK